MVTALVVLSATGCANVYEGKYNFSDGWREAKVVAVVQGAKIERPSFWECTRKLEAAQRAATDFVLLSYRGVNRQQRYMVSAPANLPVTPDERVYLKVGSCEGAIAKRTAP